LHYDLIGQGTIRLAGNPIGYASGRLGDSGMKKVFVSQPMKGKTEGEILRERYEAAEHLKKTIGEFELIDTYFVDFNGNRLQFLGRSISEGLALADIALFIGDWENFDGCRCEHFIAAQYKVPCEYFKAPA
jgi:hypothetical protein